MTGTIQFLEKSWKEIQPDKPFLYSFLDDDIAQFYSETKRLNSIVRYSSILTIFITCMGIFGLMLMTTTQRVKEIGIRKVFGAQFRHIIRLVTKEIIILAVTANVITWPLAYYFMTKWLEGYAYKTNLNIVLFLIAGILILMISVITVIYIVVKAALTNPVDSLRYE